jgi:tRNA nucleotidyltransferase/poly(A) polymerase
MARLEKYPKPGAKPQVLPATIHEDLRCRDFTVNAVALSLGKASRGLLLDPANGLGDLSLKELRALNNYTLYDDPSRILRMVRLRARLGFTIAERTLSQYANVRDAGLIEKIQPAAWKHELEQIADDALAGDILKALEEQHLLQTISPASSGPKLNLAGFQKLQKARQSVPFGVGLPADYQALFFFLLLEKLSPRERSALVKTLGLSKEQLDAATRIEAKAHKVEKELAAARLTRPSALYLQLHKVPGETLLFLLARSGQRIVIDRVRNYLQKHLPSAQEVTDADVAASGLEPGTPKFEKAKMQMIASRLDAKPKKVVVEEPAPVPASPGRKSISIAR